MGDKYVKVKAKNEGNCGKCKTKFFQGHDIYVCKGKQPMCGGCGKKQDTIAVVAVGKPDPWDMFLAHVVEGAIRAGLPATQKEAETLAQKSAKMADLLMAERAKRK